MYKFWLNYYDATSDAEAAAKAAADKAAADAEAKKFAQKDLDAYLATEKRKWQAKEQTYVQQLEELKQSKGLSDTEREKLQAQIEEIQNSSLTKEQLAAKEKEKLELGYKKDLETASSKAKSWESKFIESTIKTQISLAANAAGAVSVSQMLDILQSKAKLGPVLDAEGKETGDYETKVKVKTKEAKTGKIVILELPLDEAMKQMKEYVEEYGNLFKSTLTSGTGGTNGARDKLGQVDMENMTMAQYREWRKPNVLGK